MSLVSDFKALVLCLRGVWERDLVWEFERDLERDLDPDRDLAFLLVFFLPSDASWSCSKRLRLVRDEDLDGGR